MPLSNISNDAISEVLRTEPGTGWEAVADARQDGARSDLITSLSALDATGFTEPFDWQAEFGDRRDMLDDPAVITSADLELLRKIMTAHIRIDRTVGGHLDGLVANGYWRRCYTRLRVLLAEKGGLA